MTLKKHDFIELDYTGKLEDGTVFDTSIEGVAKNSVDRPLIHVGDLENFSMDQRVRSQKGQLSEGKCGFARYDAKIGDPIRRPDGPLR